MLRGCLQEHRYPIHCPEPDCGAELAHADIMQLLECSKELQVGGG